MRPLVMRDSLMSDWRASLVVAETMTDGDQECHGRPNGGCCGITAARVGITREGLYKKMKRLGIE